MPNITQPIASSVLSKNIGKDNIFHRPGEATLFVMMKDCLRLKNNSAFQNFWELCSFYIKIIQFRSMKGRTDCKNMTWNYNYT